MAYRDEVLADAPSRYYRLGETSGTTVVDSGSNLANLTLNGTYTRAAAGLLSTDVDAAVSFSSGAAIGARAYYADTFSVEAWVQTSDVGTGGRDVVAVEWTNWAARSSWFLELVDNVPRFVVVDNTATYRIAASSTSIGDGQPHHLVGVLGSGILRIYVDGVEVANAPLVGTSVLSYSSTSFTIGSASNGSQVGDKKFVGTIDEVAVYPVALSPARIQTHYAAGADSPLPPTQVGQVAFSGTGTLTVSGATTHQTGQAAFTGTGTLSATAVAPTLKARRFYLPSAGTPSVTPAFGAGWGLTTTATRRSLVIQPTNTLNTSVQGTETTSTVVDVLSGQFVSAPLAEQSISGTVSAVIQTWESTTSADAFLQMRIRVVSNDGSVVRGTLYGGQTETTVSATTTAANYEFTTSALTRRLSAVATTPINVAHGDRLVVELGWRAANLTTTSRSAALYFGDPTGVADYPLAVDATGGRPWVEFSQDIAFQTAANIDLSGAGSLEAGPAIKGVGFRGEGTLVANGHTQIESIRVDQAAFTGAGILTVSGHRVSLPELVVQILNPSLRRAPTTVTVVVANAWPGQMIDFFVDGNYVWSVRADSDGMLRPTSLNVGSGNSGNHTVRAQQDNAIFGQATFSLREDDDLRRGEDNPDFPIGMGSDADPVDVPGTTRDNGTRAWVWQDLYPSAYGGLGSWVMPTNPLTMSNPYLERRYTTHPTTVPVRPFGVGGQFHVMEGMDIPKEWTLEGYCPTKAMQNAMQRYRNLNRRFYIIDHHRRAWKVHITNIEWTAHRHQDWAWHPQHSKMHCTEWGHDYVVRAVVLSQNPVEPT